ncbi:MAG: hypothetical protein PHO33_03830 [Clostridia bacterium]|nr:hypothetical protein [Clostridia bacterium]
MIEVLNKEWNKYVLIIFTSEEGILLDVKVIKTELSKDDFQQKINDLQDDVCDECEKTDITLAGAQSVGELACLICKQSAISEILSILEKENLITIVESTIGLKVYKGINI